MLRPTLFVAIVNVAASVAFLNAIVVEPYRCPVVRRGDMYPRGTGHTDTDVSPLTRNVIPGRYLVEAARKLCHAEVGELSRSR